MIVGPLYSTTTNAPDIDKMVPMTLARVIELLKDRFSILKFVRQP